MAEAKEVARVRMLSSITPWSHSSTTARGNEADRAMTTLEWFRFLDTYKDSLALHKAAVELAKGDPRGKACELYRPNRQVTRQTRSESKSRALDAIVACLKGCFYIVPGEGC